VSGTDPKVEVVNINEHYVVFEGGCVCKIDTYLDVEDCELDEDDSHIAWSCWVVHPDLGPLEVMIEPPDENTRLQ